MASCSHWWHSPVYFTISVILAFMAISTALCFNNKDAENTTTRLVPINFNASTALRKSGFTIVATLLQVSPEIFFSQFPNATIFAINDASFTFTNTNTTDPSWFLKHLLQYHTSPLRLSFDDILRRPTGSCLPSLIHHKNMMVTRVSPEERLVEINNVLVSHPDLFLDHHISIHGVDGLLGGPDTVWSPVCEANSLVTTANNKNAIEWMRIIRLLGSNRFVSFAVALNSVLDGILEDHRDLLCVTIFTPLDLGFEAYPSQLLGKIVRLHILPQMFRLSELTSLPEKTLLPTLVPDQELKVIFNNVTREMRINGVQVTAPEIFSSQNFVVHGISQPLKMSF